MDTESWAAAAVAAMASRYRKICQGSESNENGVLLVAEDALRTGQ